MGKLPRSAPTRKLLLELANICDEMAKTAREVAHDYSWAEPASWDRTVGDQAETRSTGPSDTTGSVVVGKNGMRTVLRKAIGKATIGASKLGEARDLLDQAMERAEHHRPEPRRTTFPRTVFPADLAASQAAQIRREQRGEGWGEG